MRCMQRCREISRTHGLDCSRVALAELSPVTGADNNFDDINIGIEDNGKTEAMDDLLLLAKAYKESRNLQDYNEQALGDILSSSFINNQRLDPRWLSLDSEDSEAKSRVAAGGDLAMQELRKLIVAAGDPSNLDDLRSRGLLGTARTLMSRESSTDELKSILKAGMSSSRSIEELCIPRPCGNSHNSPN
ncbi:hypothetical protein FOZ60_008097 [Perkinsus olseni]|uniref:Uncharacterized protein n=1 Tax=Perkinsus olseni TaxID=32597 RepID=A0A7J6NK98_PEROL|nr:hypothetical protein FOZ60_008097 [Perkinsus olseni]